MMLHSLNTDASVNRLLYGIVRLPRVVFWFDVCLSHFHYISTVEFDYYSSKNFIRLFRSLKWRSPKPVNDDLDQIILWLIGYSTNQNLRGRVYSTHHHYTTISLKKIKTLFEFYYLLTYF